MAECLPVPRVRVKLKMVEYLPIPGVLEAENDLSTSQSLGCLKLKTTEYLPAPGASRPEMAGPDWHWYSGYTFVPQRSSGVFVACDRAIKS